MRKSQPRAIAKREERLEGSKHAALVQFDCSVVMARTQNTWTFHGTYTEHMDVPWHGPLFVGPSTRRSGLDTRAVSVEFVVGKMTLGRVFSEYFPFVLSVSLDQCSTLSSCITDGA